MKKKILIGLGSILILLGLIEGGQQIASLGSIETGDELLSTTTRAGFTQAILLKTGSGGLGSVIITGSPANTLTLYDATTTDINLRTGQKSTTTITIASFGASPTVGTYVYDSSFNDGLYLETGTAGYATATVTWR